jgi:hypothetical protein
VLKLACIAARQPARVKLFLLWTAAAVSLAAQNYYPHHNFTFGGGAGLPRGELNGLFRNRPGISIGYGYRFERYFQADVGFETVFGAGGVNTFVDTPIGFSRIRDYQFFVPVGGRAVLPLARGRFLFSGGGGGAYLRYTELLKQPSDYYRVACPQCASRSGWGYYALLGANVFLDHYQHWRLGVSSKVYRGHTSGDALADVPGVRTRDHWINTYLEFGVSF